MKNYENLGPYKITRRLGEGTFGPVLEGCDDSGQRAVIKLCTLEDQELRGRFLRAALEAQKLVHPNIVATLAVDTEEGEPWIAQEFLPGQALSAVIRRRSPLQPAARMDLLLHVARGLEAAHNQECGHYDLTPQNVRLVEGGGVKVGDFGVARLASAESGQTQRGITLGSAVYLPPEQVRGGDLDLRVDLFSYGVLAFETLTYERPFHGQTLSALLYQVLYKPPLALTSVWPSCPLPLVELVERCLEKDRDQRFGGFGELIAILSRLRREVAEGRWPGLDVVPEAPPIDVHADELMTHSAFTRTVRDVESVIAVPPALAGAAVPVVEGAQTVSLSVAPSVLDEEIQETVAAVGSGTERLSQAPDVFPLAESMDASEDKTLLRVPVETVRLITPPESESAEVEKEAAAVGSQTERLSDAPDLLALADGEDDPEEETMLRVPTETVRLTVPPRPTAEAEAEAEAERSSTQPPILAEGVGTDRLPMPPEFLDSAENKEPASPTSAETVHLPPPAPLHPTESALAPELMEGDVSAPPVTAEESVAGPNPRRENEPPREAGAGAEQRGEGRVSLGTLRVALPDSVSTAFQPADSDALTVRLPVTSPKAPVPEQSLPPTPLPPTPLPPTPSPLSKPIPSPPAPLSPTPLEEAEPTASYPVVSPSSGPPVVPSHPQMKESAVSTPGPVSSTPELASRAEEIGQLVAEGKLEAALEQLESVRRQQTPEIPPETPATGAVVASSSPASTFPSKPQPPTPTVPAPVAALPLMGSAGDPGLQEMDLQPHRPPARRKEAVPGRRKLGRRWLWGLAAAIPLLLAVGWGVVSSRRAPEAVEPAIPAPPISMVEPEMGGRETPETGLLVLQAAPWGQVTEITDGNGYSVSLPEEVHTPLALYLPPGVYRIVLEYVEEGVGPAVQTCEVEVNLSTPEVCSITLVEPDVTAYFKENGWWR